MRDIPIPTALIISLFCGFAGWFVLTKAGNAGDLPVTFEEQQSHAPTDARHAPGADGSDPLRPFDRAFHLKGAQLPQ